MGGGIAIRRGGGYFTMLQKIDIDALWLEIWKSHWSFQKWLTAEQSDVAQKEMLQELDESIARAGRTFGDD